MIILITSLFCSILYLTVKSCCMYYWYFMTTSLFFFANVYLKKLHIRLCKHFDMILFEDLIMSNQYSVSIHVLRSISINYAACKAWINWWILHFLTEITNVTYSCSVEHTLRNLLFCYSLYGKLQIPRTHKFWPKFTDFKC